MYSLRDVQRAFARSVLSDDAAPLAALIRGGEVGAEARVRIYRNNHRAGLLAALRATYPVIERLGGADWFAQSVRRYQTAYPPRRGDLQCAGEDYPRFLRSELCDGAFDYFADVAALEWAYQEVLIAAESAPIDAGALREWAAEDYPRLVLEPRAALRLVRSRYPIHAIWRAHQRGSDDAFAIDLNAGASRVLVIRRHDHVELRELAEPSWALLAQCVAGATLGAAVEAVTAAYPDHALERVLHELFVLQVFSGIRLGVVPDPSRQ
jgi:Putative DNA-binding domain